MSKYSNDSVTALLQAEGKAYEILSSEVGKNYPVDASAISGLHASAFALQTAENAQLAAMQAAKARTAEKGVRKEDLASRMATIQAVVTASPTVTDPMLIALGFPPRRGAAPRPKLPQAATGLTATPDGMGDVALVWKRGSGDSRSVVSFLVEYSLDAGATWSLLDTTRRVSLTAANFAPGVAAWFRVTATSAAGRAQPSAPAPIYAPTPEVALSLTA